MLVISCFDFDLCSIDKIKHKLTNANMAKTSKKIFSLSLAMHMEACSNK